MDKSQIVAITGAFLIASGAVAGVRAWANASARATLEEPSAVVESIHTLAPIEVRPTREQLQMLRSQTSRAAAPNPALGGGFAMDMPYYSFAVQPTRASRS